MSIPLHEVANSVGIVLLIVTVATSSYQAWRTRDRHHLDVLLLVLSIFAAQVLLRRQDSLAIALLQEVAFLSQSYFLLRLVAHFKDVPRTLTAVTLLACVALPAALYYAPATSTPWLTSLRNLFQTGVHGFSRIVAVKTILPGHSGDGSFQRMFLDEARIAARLRHANVVEVLCP